MSAAGDRYSHGHHESVLRSHRWRTAENSAGFLLPYLVPGQALLDVGCGPGTITVDFARRIHPGPVHGVDVAPEIVELARRDAPPPSDANVHFDVGDVYSIDAEDGAYDVVYAHQVLQHLTDPIAAVREMKRVLRRPGVLAVRDSDYGAFAWAPGDARLDRWMALYRALTARNGAEADAGRHLARWVRAAGFSSMTVSSSTWTFHTADERAWWGELWSERVRESEFAHQILEYGLTTRAELDTIADAFLAWAADEDGVFIVVHGEVLARV